MTGVLNKKKGGDTETRHREDRGRDGTDVYVSQGMPRTAGGHQELRGAWDGFSLRRNQA